MPKRKPNLGNRFRVQVVLEPDVYGWYMVRVRNYKRSRVVNELLRREMERDKPSRAVSEWVKEGKK